MHLTDTFQVTSQCLPLFLYAVWSSSGQILLCARELLQLPTHTLPQFDSVAEMMNMRQYMPFSMRLRPLQRREWKCNSRFHQYQAFLHLSEMCRFAAKMFLLWRNEGLSYTQCAVKAGILLTTTLNYSLSEVTFDVKVMRALPKSRSHLNIWLAQLKNQTHERGRRFWCIGRHCWCKCCIRRW